MQDIKEIKCPNCQCDDLKMLDNEGFDRRTREHIYFCNNCSKIFRIRDDNGVSKTTT